MYITSVASSKMCISDYHKTLKILEGSYDAVAEGIQEIEKRGKA